MKFINKTGNTIQLSDIGKDVYYLENNQTQDISLDEAKASLSFRQMLMLGKFYITECGDSVFEKGLLQLQKNIVPKKQKEEVYSDPSSQLEVKIKGHFVSAGGYAKVNRNLAFGLSSLGVKVQIDPIGNAINDLSEEEIRELNKLKTPVSKQCISIDSIIPSFVEVSRKTKYNILYTTIESSTIPQQFTECCSMYNEIWVPSDFCKEVLESSNVKKRIIVMPNTIDTNLYKEDVDPHQFNPPLKKFVFGSVFGWSYRKGYDALLRSYLEEFTGDDPVSLLIVSRYQYNEKNKDVVKEKVQQFISKYGGKNPPHIARCSRAIPEKDMPNIYKAMNCFVLLSRGEGFGLIFAEASLCGVPVIATNYSGHTMFLNKENSCLIDPDAILPMPPEKYLPHYWVGQKMASLLSEDFISRAKKSLRNAFNNYDKLKKKNNKLSSFIKKNYTTENVSKMAKNRLEEIWRSK